MPDAEKDAGLPWADDVEELRQRITKGADHLREMAHAALDRGQVAEAARLQGKREGMTVALSYVEEMQRIRSRVLPPEVTKP